MNSAKIADNTIVNADISPSAAIANTKIAGLGSLATVTPTGTANSTTFLRGDNSWAVPAGGGGATVDLVATKSVAQTVPTGGSAVLPSDIPFETTVTAPSIAGATFNGTTYTVGQTGFYLINVFLLQDNTSSFGVAPQLLVNGTPVLYGDIGISGNFPPGTIGRGTLTAVLSLTAGNTIKIQGTNNNSGGPATLSTNGTTRITIVKF